MTIIDICQIEDISIEVAERALANLQDKGLITGYVPGDLRDIRLTTAAAPHILITTLEQK